MSRASAIVLCLLLALPLLGLGGASAWLAGKPLWDRTRSSDWVRVKAEVVPGSFGTRPGEPGSTHFAYAVDGQRYQGRRLGPGGIFPDDLDEWRVDVAEDLAKAKAAGQSLSLWVDPARPADSMLHRDVPLDTLVLAGLAAAAFGLSGLGALKACVSIAAGAVEPKGDGQGGAGFLWGFGFVWNAIAFGISALVLPDIIDSGEWAGFFVLLFPLVGVLLVWGATAATVAAIMRRIRKDAVPPGRGGRRPGQSSEPKGARASRPANPKPGAPPDPTAKEAP